MSGPICALCPTSAEIFVEVVRPVHELAETFAGFVSKACKTVEEGEGDGNPTRSTEKYHRESFWSQGQAFTQQRELCILSDVGQFCRIFGFIKKESINM